MPVFAIFYKKKSFFLDDIVRWRTNSIYSHCELVISEDPFNDEVSVLYSSSPRDNGVRIKKKILRAENWDAIRVPWISEQSVIDFYNSTSEAHYDWLGLLVGQSLSFNIQRKERWFCSEWCATALNLNEAWRYSPGMLFIVLNDMFKVYTEALSNAN
jgi:hypothetical protein